MAQNFGKETESAFWGVRGRDGVGGWGQQMHTIICRMDTQQGPAV